MRRVNRALRLISLCNQEIVRATDEAALLQAVCRIAVKHGGYRLAWVGFAEQDEAKSVCVAAQAGFVEGYLDNVNITWADAERGRSPTGTAIRTGQPALARNIPTDPAFAPWRAEASQRGYASSIALPLISEGCCIGALMMYAGEPDAFDPGEIELLTEMANDLAYGIGALRHRAERMRVEETLHESEARYRALFDQNADGILIADLETKIFKYANPAMCRMLGYTEDELRTKGVQNIHPKDAVQSVVAEFEAQARGDKTMARDIPCLKKDGSIVHVDINSFKITIDGRPCNVGIFRDITERKQAEEALRKSEEKYRGLFESSRDAFMTVELPSGRFSAGNAAALKMFGMKDEAELISHGPWELSPERQPDGRASVEKAGEFNETALRDGSCFFEWMHRRMGGEEFPADVLLTRTEQGGKMILHAAVRDITERKRAEEAVRESQALYHSLVDQMPAGVFRKDRAGRYVYVNSQFCQFRGLKAEQIVGRTVDELLAVEEAAHSEKHPEILQLLRGGSKHHEEIMRTGKPICVEEVYPTADGGKRHLYVVKSAVFGPGGEIVGTQGVHFDITALKQVEEEIKRVAQEWQNTFDATKDAIWILDLNNRILRANKTAKKFFKRPCSEMTGKPCWEIVHGTTEPIPNCPYVRSRKSGQRETMELQQDGRWFEVIVDPIFDDAGQYAGAVHIVSDITEHRKLEAQFRQAQKMEAVGTLASGVAHDFNNILGVILGYGDLLTADLDPDSPLLKYAEEIRNAAERATGLTRQLLVFSRKQKVEPVVLDLNDTMKDLEKMLRRLIGENIEMMVVPGKEIGHIKADAGSIGQVLMNLAVNARDAMPNGGTLTLETANVSFDQDSVGRHPELKPGDYVMLTVSDTGIGMTPEVKAHLFEALFTTKPAGKGTGLGLATCQTIVQQSERPH